MPDVSLTIRQIGLCGHSDHDTAIPFLTCAECLAETIALRLVEERELGRREAILGARVALQARAIVLRHQGRADEAAAIEEACAGLADGDWQPTPDPD